MSRQSRIEQAIAAATGLPAEFVSVRAIAGGIHDSGVAVLRDGRRFFIKCQSARRVPGMFAADFRSLRLLAEPASLVVPEAVAYGEDFLVLEAFTEGRPAADWQERMGRGLALLHRATRREKFGFELENYLGTTPQLNAWRETWLAFWRGQRLESQLRLFSARAGKDDPLVALGKKLLDHLDVWLADVREPAVLLHGDLWSGNAAAGEAGEPVIFDPASYYGHREAEFGMMRLFGGFGPRCEAAYSEIWPFEPGFEERVALYRLYHELNHLNLFGGGYYQGCLATIKSLL